LIITRSDPGPCLICGAPHCSCSSGPLLIPQLPARDAGAAAVEAPRLKAEEVQATLPPGSFTSGTYRGDKKPKRRL
jgi:hypothetical protein